jgi:hypothetical protein
VQNKNAFPVTNNANSGGSTLVTDLGFLHAAFSTALKYAGSSTRLVSHVSHTVLVLMSWQPRDQRRT